MFKTAVLSFLLTFFAQESLAQNLVPNSDFEIHKHFFTFRSLGGLSNWFKVNSSTPDYNGELNIGGRQKPFNGRSYVGLFWQNNNFEYVEYLSVKLKQPLQKGVTYNLSMYVSLGDDSKFALSSLEAVLSVKKIKSKGTKFIYHANYTTLSNSEDSILNDKKSWKKISGIYKSNGGEQYLTIGYFNPHKTWYKVVKPKESELRTYYYIDGVELYPINEGSKISDTFPSKSISLFQNEAKSNNDTLVISNINFSSGSSKLELDSSNIKAISQLVEQLINKVATVEIYGHTDSIGNSKQNEKLSLERAESLKGYLIQRGIKPEQIFSFGMGATVPLTSNNTEEQRRLNRRLEIIVRYKQ